MPRSSATSGTTDRSETGIAFVVRMTLMPVVMSLLGRRAWWLSRWLDRVVLNVDVEGAGLEGDPVPMDSRGVVTTTAAV